jgi:hypothetical protein
MARPDEQRVLLAAFRALQSDWRSEPNFMPDWIGDQMAGVRPDATRVFGRNRKERPFAEGLFEKGLAGPLTEGGCPGL